MSNRSVRVLLYDHTAELGGGEIALVELVRRLDRTRVDPVVLLASHGPLDDLLEGAVPLYHLLMPREVSEARRAAIGRASFQNVTVLLSLVRYIRLLAKFVKRHEIDIIHTNSLKASILGGIAGRLAGKKVIWHLRDRIADDYLPPRMVFVVRKLGRWLPDFVVGNSRATVATLDLRGTPSAAVPSGVDVSKFHPAPDPELTESPRRIVGLVGRICPWKGQHVFIEAAGLLRKEWPNVQFQIVGGALFGEQAYEAELREKVLSAGLEDVVSFSGFQSDVPSIIRRFYMLVHASTVGEPFGQVIVQAMATAKPVVATNGGGVPETVVDGETGILVPMGNASAMAEAIAKLLESPSLAAQMGHAGYERVIERFTLSQTTESITKIYEQLAQKEVAA